MTYMPEPLKIMIFVDGENLCRRIQAMRDEDGMEFKDSMVYKNDFAWPSEFHYEGRYRIIRSTYYTSTNRIDQVGELEKIIRTHKVLEGGFQGWVNENPWIPRVFARDKGTQRSKGVDINLAVDALNAAINGHTDAILIASGDGDFIPLITEIQRYGKVVYGAAVSKGLSPRIPLVVDRFVNMDEMVFKGKVA
jgi:uncharacterized LabA/DUF88 family protein